MSQQSEQQSHIVSPVATQQQTRSNEERAENDHQIFKEANNLPAKQKTDPDPPDNISIESEDDFNFYTDNMLL